MLPHLNTDLSLYNPDPKKVETIVRSPGRVNASYNETSQWSLVQMPPSPP